MKHILEKNDERVQKAVADKFEQRVLNQLIKEGRPTRLTALFVDRPICVFATGFVLFLIIALVSSSQGYFELSELNNREYLVWDNHKVIDWDKQVAGREAILEAQSKNDQKPVRIQNTLAWNPIILIKAPSQTESLLTKEYLL